MKNAKDVQELISRENNSYSIDEIKQVYDSVDTSQELVIAQIDDIKHIFYRDRETRKFLVDRDLLKYERVICDIMQHKYYPLDLCNLTFYDNIINRYGNGIVIPRLKKFVIVNDSNLIMKPNSSSFYTIGIDEDNKRCGSIVDKMGNIYRMYGYGEDTDDFSIYKMYKLNRSLMLDCYGVLISYKGRPVFASTINPPYIILDKTTLMDFCSDVHIEYMKSESDNYLETFDDGFMEGRSYVRKIK